MSEPTDQFKRNPRRKGSRAKTVVVSAEAKQAYSDLMRERDERALSYAQHLPSTDGRK